jgi:hypothetical protein
MNKKILLIIIFLVSALLITVVVSGIHEKKPSPKGKKASPTPSISISPYRIPLPMMKSVMLHVQLKPA